MKGGYSLIDCGGLDLISETSQSITGLNHRVAKAYKDNKPVYACNCFWGDDYITPVSVMINPLPGTPTSYVCTSSTLQIIVAIDDSVTIVNMAPSIKTSKK